MHANNNTIEKFYSSFQNLDSEAMCECYGEQVVFYDPVFTQLRVKKIKAMWKMLCNQATDFSLNYSDVEANEFGGSANWQARYKFSATGRKVVNKVHTKFKFQDGKIIDQLDQFNFWKWSSMALGPIGLILGWSPMLQNKIRQSANSNLDIFISKNKL